MYNFQSFLLLLIEFKIYNTVRELPKSWDTLPTNDIFLKSNFLEGLERSFPTNITAYYIGVFKNHDLVGIAIIQRVEMYADDIFRKTDTHKLKHFAKQMVSKIVKGNALVVGNLMHTGQHGMFFMAHTISQTNYLNEIENAVNVLIDKIKQKFNKKVRIIVFKDYFETDTIHNSQAFFKANNLYKIQVQPNMIFNIPDSWKSKEDYISSFNKKYKRRYQTARKKASGLSFKELDEIFLKTHETAIFNLYENVSDNARVNSFKLNPSHFYELKTHLKDKFKVFGVFSEDQLVGFYTLILNHDILETYFLGYDKELQHKHQMYLNMLYNMACYGIDNRFKSIVFARTAMEIKSSIGAKPYPMYIYLNHTNSFIANTVLKGIVKYMNPIQEWQERNPFK
jgi:hypothetical protein